MFDMELNVKKWNIFEVGELFEPKRGNFTGLKNDLIKGTKVISANTNNNGFGCFTNKQPEYNGNVFTIANTGQGSVGVVFYQDEPFIPSNNITVLIPKFDLSKNIAMFLLPLFKKERYRLSFGRILNEPRLKKHTIKLPIDDNKNPDWNFMEKYINNITTKISAKISIQEKPYHIKEFKLTDKEWKYFRYDDDFIFSVEKGSNIRVRDIVPNGKTPLISAVKRNNGISGMVNAEPQYDGNVIVVNGNGNGGVGEAFYQPIPFCATIDVNILKPKFELNEFIGMFLVCLIRKERYKFSFGRKWKPSRMKESLIMLPVTKDGDPDWQFIEDYVKSLPYSSNLK
jgi:hypothetical protein